MRLDLEVYDTIYAESFGDDDENKSEDQKVISKGGNGKRNKLLWN